MWMMISFTDDELALLMSCAAEIAPPDRDGILRHIVAEIECHPTRDRGRVINDVQRRWIDRSNPCNKDRQQCG